MKKKKIQRAERIFAGHYKRYDGKLLYVVMVVKDEDTGEEIVIYHDGVYSEKYTYYALKKESFCDLVTVDGEAVKKFARQPQIEISDLHLLNLGEDGFCNSRRIDYSCNDVLTKEKDTVRIRVCRESTTYKAYAKDLCDYYREDLRRYKLSCKQKKFVGVMGNWELTLEKDLLMENL